MSEFIRKEFAEDIAAGMARIYKPPFDKFSLDDQMVAYMDLNADSRPEIFVRITHVSMCGSAGCATYIFTKRKGRWTRIGDFYTGEDIHADGARHGGWLAVYSFNACALWDGGRYRSFRRHNRVDEKLASCRTND